MISQNAQLWIDALRSGRFKQTRGQLEDVNGCCCLGVACRVAIENGVTIEVRSLSKEISEIYDRSEGSIMFDGHVLDLPKEVQLWLGLKDNQGCYNDGNNSLADDNDERMSFKEIAQKIEAHSDQLFSATRDDPI